MRLLKLVFRLILVACSALFPMPTIVYWEHAVRQEAAWASGWWRNRTAGCG
jgi:hypothetical protein